MTKSLSEALEETVKEIQGYSKEELIRRLEESEQSKLAMTVNELLTFAEFTDEGGKFIEL